jgi:hypothetical protein
VAVGGRTWRFYAIHLYYIKWLEVVRWLVGTSCLFHPHEKITHAKENHPSHARMIAGHPISLR